jgi:hypothetical protein
MCHKEFRNEFKTLYAAEKKTILNAWKSAALTMGIAPQRLHGVPGSKTQSSPRHHTLLWAGKIEVSI